MRILSGAAFIAILVQATAAGQQNPFDLTGGSVKSAHIVYQVTSKQQPAEGINYQAGATTYEVGVSPDRWIMRMVAPVEISGKRDTMRTVVASSGDSQYTYLEMGPGTASGEVSVILRRHLAKEYAALDAAGKARFKENLKLISKSSTGSFGDTDELITLTGEKKGSETVAGHQCDVYQREATTTCVMPQAPGVILRWADAKEGTSLVAKKVTLNGPVPSTASFLPKGVRWKKQGYDDDEFAPALWEFKKQSDSRKVPPAALAKFAVGYLASPGAAAELRAMDSGMGGGEDEPSDDGDEEMDDSEN